MHEGRFIHRGQWEGQEFPNSFETAKLYGAGIETDVMLLGDGQTLGIIHPADFGLKDADVEQMTPEDFARLKVRKGDVQGGAAPFFNEYLALCYDRGIPALFEIKGSTEEKTAAAARKTVEAIAEMQKAGTFKVGDKEHPKYLEQMGMHSYSTEVVKAAKEALAKTGLKLDVGFTWISDKVRAEANPLAQGALTYHREGETWEQGGIRAAADLGCEYVFFMEPARMTKELVDQAHASGVKLYVYIRPTENSEDLRDRLLKLGVDKLLF